MGTGKKVVSTLVMAGMLTGVVGVAYAADETTVLVPNATTMSEKHQGGMRGAMMSKDTLQTLIADLDEDQQAEIMALYEQLAPLKPATDNDNKREKVEFTEEQKTIHESYRQQVIQLEQQLAAVLDEYQLSIDTASDEMVNKLDMRPNGRSEMKGISNGATIPSQATSDGKGRGLGFIKGTLSENILAQLSEADRATALDLQEQIAALREAEREALGIDLPTPPAKEAMTQAQQDVCEDRGQLRQQLMDKLKEAGIEMPVPEKPSSLKAE